MVETAAELAERIKATAADMRRTGGYSVEAEALIRMADDLAAVAERVAALEELAKHDIAKIVDAVLAGRRPPPIGEPKVIRGSHPES